MLSQEEFSSWCKGLGISSQARAVLEQVRSSAPARHVGGGGGNVSGRYPSKKMGVTIQFESHRVELAAVYEMEHDPDVLEYYDQPPPFRLDYEAKGGQRLARRWPLGFPTGGNLRRAVCPLLLREIFQSDQLDISEKHPVFGGLSSHRCPFG